MKTIVSILSILLISVSLNSCGSSSANTTKTFKVWGNCEMCKETIEGSLKVDGIESADWNVDSKIITVSFDDKKISLAAVGYDNEKYKGDDKAYNELPECCMYDRK